MRRTARGLVIVVSILGLLSAAGRAAEIRVGEKLPPLRITDRGESVIRGDEVVFEPWESSRLLGKLHVVEYLAARVGVGRIHEPLHDALRAAHFPAGELVVTKLINSDDALWGTSGLVPSRVAESKKEHPEIGLVVDANGIGRREWSLHEGGGAVALVDASGIVRFFREGELTADEIRAFVSLARERLLH